MKIKRIGNENVFTDIQIKEDLKVLKKVIFEDISGLFDHVEKKRIDKYLNLLETDEKELEIFRSNYITKHPLDIILGNVTPNMLFEVKNIYINKVKDYYRENNIKNYVCQKTYSKILNYIKNNELETNLFSSLDKLFEDYVTNVENGSRKVKKYYEISDSTSELILSVLSNFYSKFKNKNIPDFNNLLLNSLKNYFVINHVYEDNVEKTKITNEKILKIISENLEYDKKIDVDNFMYYLYQKSSVKKEVYSKILKCPEPVKEDAFKFSEKNGVYTSEINISMFSLFNDSIILGDMSEFLDHFICVLPSNESIDFMIEKNNYRIKILYTIKDEKLQTPKVVSEINDIIKEVALSDLPGLINNDLLMEIRVRNKEIREVVLSNTLLCENEKKSRSKIKV